MARHNDFASRRTKSMGKLTAGQELHQRFQWINSYFGGTKGMALYEQVHAMKEPLLRNGIDTSLRLPVRLPEINAGSSGRPLSKGSQSMSMVQLPRIGSPGQGQAQGNASRKSSRPSSIGAAPKTQTPPKQQVRMSAGAQTAAAEQEEHRRGSAISLQILNEKEEIKAFSASRKSIRRFDPVDAKAAQKVSSRLTELQVKDIFRSVTRGTMESLSEVATLIDIWRMGGHPNGVNAEWLDELTLQETESSFIDTANFLNIWTAYFDRVEEFQEDVFNEGADDSGVAVATAVPAMFHKLKFWPMPGALKEALDSVVDARRRDNGIEMEDFVNVYSDLYSRTGLTRSEQTHALQIFAHHADGKDFLTNDAFRAAVAAIEPHFMLTRQEPQILPDCLIDAIANEAIDQMTERRLTVDFDAWSSVLEASERAPIKDGNVPVHVFLVACNVLHQCVADHLESVAERIGLSVQSKFSEQDVIRLFDELGHVAPQLDVVLKELMEHCEHSGRDRLSFGEVYTVVLLFCNLESFSCAERQRLTWIYNLFTTELPDVELDALGHLSTNEIQRLLRWLCYCPSEHRFYDFMDGYVSENVTHLDFHDTMKVVADFRYANVGRARKNFCKTKEMADQTFQTTWNDIPVTELESVMGIAGHTCSQSELLGLVKELGDNKSNISWREFLFLEGCHRERLTEKLKKNQGFTDVESTLMQTEFELYTVRNSKHILYGGFEKLVVKYIPHIEINDRVRELVLSSDPHHTNKIDFRQYLWVMRRLFDQDSKATMGRANQLRDEIGYSKKDGKALRELFNGVDADLSGSVDLHELKFLFAGLIEMDDHAHFELGNFLKKVDVNRHGSLDFFEFLRLMKSLEEINWRNILNKAEKQVDEGARGTGEDDDSQPLMMHTKSKKSLCGAGHDFML